MISVNMKWSESVGFFPALKVSQTMYDMLRMSSRSPTQYWWLGLNGALNAVIKVLKYTE